MSNVKYNKNRIYSCWVGYILWSICHQEFDTFLPTNKMEVNPQIFAQVDPGGKKPSAPAALGGQAVMSRPTVIKLEGAAGARARAPTPDSSVKVMEWSIP
jgi:hypothetical protein